MRQTNDQQWTRLLPTSALNLMLTNSAFGGTEVGLEQKRAMNVHCFAIQEASRGCLAHGSCCTIRSGI